MGLLSGILGIFGASAQAKAAKQGAQLQYQASQDAIAEQRRQFDTIRGDTAPYREVGANALGQIGAGMEAGDFNLGLSLDQFQADPGYQFRLDEGRRAIESSAAARGGALSGGAIKAGQRYASGLASQEFNDAFRRNVIEKGGRFDQLTTLAGIGSSGVGQSAAAGLTTAGQVGNLTMAGGNALASGKVGAANAWANGLSNLGSGIESTAGNLFGYFG